MSQPTQEMAAGGTLRDFGKLAHMWWPLLLGNVLEWYEFGVYGYLSGVMAQNFFHGSALGTWTGFAITFLLRPVGGICFGCFADAVGRRNATLYSMVGMLTATVGQGLLPGSVVCGPMWGNVGLVLLCVLRGLQGVATGGEIGSLVTYFAETAPAGTKGMGTVMFLFTAVVAFVFASSFVAFLFASLGEEAMLVWGWRLPFLVSVGPGLLTLWGRSRLPESPEFLLMQAQVLEEERARSKVRSAGATPTARDEAGSEVSTAADEAGSPNAEKALAVSSTKSWTELWYSNSANIALLFKEHRRAVILGYTALAANSALFYLGLWTTTNLHREGLDKETSLYLSMVFMAVMAIVATMGGYATDRCLKSDPKHFMTWGQVLTAASAVPVFLVLSRFPGNATAAALALVLFGVAAGVAYAPAYLWCAELFPTRWRALGFGLTFNLAVCTVGGTASLAAEALHGISPLAPAVYLAALALLSLAAVLRVRHLQARGRLARFALGDGTGSGKVLPKTSIETTCSRLDACP